MALTIPNGGAGGGARILSSYSTRHTYTYTRIPIPRHVLFPLSPRTTSHIVSAKRFTSRTGRLDGKNRRSSTTTKDEEERTAEIKRGGGPDNAADLGIGNAVSEANDGYFLPKLPGDDPDFWEGEKWDALGFFVEYLWAFGIVFALIACGIAVATYNEGATDFKSTPVYKESVQSQEALEGPEASNPDVFESNPTEVAPSLE
ncbi:hypothetical protein UlMin_008545 [Ulmus minor]